VTEATQGQDHDCVACGARLTFFDRATVLERYDVEFHLCPSCGLITAPNPYWLDEAYSSAIYDGDSGLLRRSKLLSTVTSLVIRSERLTDGTFLDWAGGYGALARMMRDKGYDFRTFDPYAKNLLAPGFDGDELESHDLVTAFEVVEHLADPVEELTKVAAANDRLFFTTMLHPADQPPRPSEWWYYMLESGQHIAFHTIESLQILAERLGYQLTSNGENYHLFHRVPVRATTKVVLSQQIAKRRAAVRSLVRRAAPI
jgi:hypothetical protein